MMNNSRRQCRCAAPATRQIAGSSLTARPASPNTLFLLSLEAFVKTIDSEHINVDYVEQLKLLKQLPNSLQTDVRLQLKKNWQDNTVTGPPEELSKFEFRDIQIDDKLDKHEFVMLMHHPVHTLPEVWPDDYESTGHIYFDFYRRQHGDDYNTSLNLCRKCFLKLCNTTETLEPDDDDADDTYYFDYEHYWQQMGWKFFKCTWHETIEPAQFICCLVKRSTSWCDHCVITPLFRLYNRWSCRAYTNAHVLDDNSDDSDDSDRTNLFVPGQLQIYDPYFH